MTFLVLKHFNIVILVSAHFPANLHYCNQKKKNMALQFFICKTLCNTVKKLNIALLSYELYKNIYALW